MKNFSIYKIATVVAALLLSIAVADAQSLKILDMVHGTTEANIKAEIIGAEGKSVTKVVARTFYMPTGSSTVSESYRLIGDRYIVGILDYHEGADYFYRLEVSFDDGTEIMTDCYNADYTEGAVWLSDLPITSKSSSDLAVGIDQAVTGVPIQIHPTSTFAKGISIFYPGEVTYNVSCKNEHGVPFTHSKFTLGLQAYLPDGSTSTGSARLIYKMNGAETGSKGNMFAYSNTSRGKNTYYFDQTQANANGINSVGFQVTTYNSTVKDDNACNLAACRLYYSVPAQSTQPQTITFDNPGGAIHENSPEVLVGAYATGLTPIYYSIVQGADLASFENNVLRPHYGKKGTIVIEAFTPGDDNYAPASATQTYTFNFAPTVQYLFTHQNLEDQAQQSVFLYVDTQDTQLETLSLDIYDDARSFLLVQTIDILGSGLEKYATSIPHVYAIPFNSASALMAVHQLKYKFAGEEEVVGRLTEGDETFIYMSDIPGIVTWSNYTIYKDIAFNNNGRLANERYSYSKGYGVHASNGNNLSTLETPTSFSLEPFYRFAVDVSGQKNNYGNMVAFQLFNGTTTAYLNTGNVDPRNVYEWDFVLQSTGTGKTLKVAVGNAGDGYGQDVTCIGAPRFYYIIDNMLSQTISWDTEQYINNYHAFTVPLTATSSSGLPVVYRVAKGTEYAKIVDGSTLSIVDLPDENADIVVEAVQPGDKVYAHSDAVYCTFKLSRSVILQPDDRMTIDGGSTLNELIVYANPESSGQIEVASGVVNIEHLLLKYTFTPGEWAFISFPSNFNLSDISNLSAKGYTYATEEGTSKTFLLREYDSRTRSENRNESAWVSPDAPNVVGSKGYIMKIEDDANEPVEITFEMDNVALDFENTSRDLFLSLDLTETEPESRHTVYLRPSNVKGNTLRVDVRFTPIDSSLLPVNHAKALEAMRVTHTPVRGAIRLTLPEQSPARVAIFDKSGKHLLKAVNYISPMKINISDLKPGTYRMVVLYGNASRELLVDL